MTDLRSAQQYMTVVEAELQRQIDTLVARGYPQACGIDEGELRRALEPLTAHAEALTADWEPPTERTAPFVVVVSPELVAAAAAMERTELAGRCGFTNFTPVDPDAFTPIDAVTLPKASAYLITGVDTGTAFLDVRPQDALPEILANGRSPLTIHEGIAVVTHHPQLLRKNACFSLSASRGGDQRVPAIWISDRRPRLGWCWDGNPHTWLGSASCAARR